MATLHSLIGTLKRELRSRHIRYRDIAKTLQMSEANVKRMFSSAKLTTDRMDQICAMMNMDISDLVASHETEINKIDFLEEQQEKELVSDINLLLVAVCVRNHLTLEEITREYNLSESQCVRILAKLDRMGLIELLPNNRVRLLVSEQFRWLRNGPIETYFEQNMQQEFLKSHFLHENETRYFLTGRVSATTHGTLQKKLSDFARDFEALYKEEVRTTSQSKKNIGILLAMRPWEYSRFKKIEK